MSIKLIALDMDGTLLNNQHQLSPRNEAALRQAMAQGIQVILATGKTRHSAVPIIEKLDLRTPGVYVQGLLITNGDGSIRYQTTLDMDLANDIARFAQEKHCAMVAYAGNRLLTNVRNKYTDLFIQYHEPVPEAGGTWDNVLSQTHVNKFIMVSTKAEVDTLRPQLEAYLNGRATVVQALDNMIEILPYGISKGRGVQQVLRDLGIVPTEIMAIGDGENDVEMLQMAGIGVAMGNAMPAAKAVADRVTSTNDEDGVAQAVWQLLS